MAIDQTLVYRVLVKDELSPIKIDIKYLERTCF